MTKVAVLIDGEFFLKGLPRVRSDIDVQDAKEVVGAVNELVHTHLAEINECRAARPTFRTLTCTAWYPAR